MPEDRDDVLRTVGLVGQIGIRMVLFILIGFFLGMYLDRLFGVRGPFLIALLLGGVAAGFWSCYKVIIESLETECPRKRPRKPPSQT